jgi:cellulose synthase/poly-beta-1,6-N-acetylglucosamine synthase-like glycosyltransferase
MISLLIQVAALALFLAGAASFAMLFKGCCVLRRQARRSSRDDSAILLKSAQMPMVSVLAVAPDVSPESRAFVRRLLDLHFSHHEVLLVLDGPSEHEFEKWTDEFRLIPTSRATWESLDPLRLVVLKTERAGVAAAYNAGVERAAGSLIAIFDRESAFIPEALLRLVPPMLQDPEGTTAVCGIAPDLAYGSLIQRFAAIEALRIWLARCAAFAGWNMLIPVPGCCLLIRRDAIRQAGGFPASPAARPAFAAPLELILHLHGQARAGGAPFRMALVAEPVSHAPAPQSREQLRHLIVRDQRTLRAAFLHRKSIARGTNAIGWGLRALFFDRVLRPLVETLLYVLTAIGILTGLVPIKVGGLVLLCTIGTGILVSMGAVVFRELAEYRGSDPRQLAALFFAAIPENLGYRQMRNIWLVDGFLKGKTR